MWLYGLEIKEEDAGLLVLIPLVVKETHVHVALSICRWCIRFILTSLKLEFEKALFLR